MVSPSHRTAGYPPPGGASSTAARVRRAPHLALVVLAVLLAACDHGLVPPGEPPTGALQVVVTYAGHPASWPPADSLQDLRFFAMPFVPQDTTDFLQLNRITFSERLPTGVAADTILLADVEQGTFVYAGVAQKYGADLFAWRPVGLYEENGGIFRVLPGDTTRIHVPVDFRRPPLFPPS